MSELALGIYVLFAVLAFGWRGWLQYRRTGDYGFRRFSGPVGSFEWWGGSLLTVGACAGFMALVIDLSRSGSRFSVVLPVAARRGGLALMVLGVVLTLVAQVQMGSSWRVGLDASEVTELVTTGPFRWVRNPIFAAILMLYLGLCLTVPNGVACIALVLSFAGIELQVRRVEEPYLIRVHGERYLSYTHRVGRFLPGLGLIR